MPGVNATASSSSSLRVCIHWAAIENDVPFQISRIVGGDKHNAIPREAEAIVWLDGDTDRVAGGGSLSCAAGPGGGGCFGFAWGQKDADYNAAVWDLKELESAGTVSTDVSGTSFLPALVVPIPLIARTQTAACKGLADQLRNFISDEPSA